jgi:hypothetical protein
LIDGQRDCETSRRKCQASAWQTRGFKRPSGENPCANDLFLGGNVRKQPKKRD